MKKKFSLELHVTKETPPTFIVHGKIDKSVKLLNSELYVEALKKNGVPHVFVSVPDQGHNVNLEQAGCLDDLKKWIVDVTTK